ncbi:MAG TPA: hypothetical protein VMV43_04270 [Candidatus Nanopelagicaceae bacterium]|nr:hypothetical protein [Candidatus Nanopelagicaceae bacterium]
MENDVLITEKNMYDLRDQDLAGMEALLESEEFNMNFALDPVQTPKPMSFKICNCGNPLQENPKGEYRCSQCGRIKYKGVKK